jgi:ABC-2 type transport system ATP-binding protein
VRTPDAAAAITALDGRVVGRDGVTLVVRHDDPAALNAQLVAAGVRVAELVAERRSLEQVVLELTGSGTDRMDTPGGRPRAADPEVRT